MGVIDIDDLRWWKAWRRATSLVAASGRDVLAEGSASRSISP